MHTKTRQFITLALLVIVGLLLSTAPNVAAARVQRTTLSGEQTGNIVSIGNVTTSGRWTKFRDVQLTGPFAFISDEGVPLAGTVTRVVNVKVDAANNGRLAGTITYVFEGTGVTCQGTHQGKLTDNYFAGSVVAPCSDGRRLKGELGDTALVYDANGALITVVSQFTGVLLTPGR